MVEITYERVMDILKMSTGYGKIKKRRRGYEKDFSNRGYGFR